MTEAEWLACEDTKPMFELLRDRVSDRKLCLFAASCCRSIWHYMKKRSRRSVEVTERFFEGRARQPALDAAITEATAAFEEAPDTSIEHHITLAASLVPVNDVEEADCVAYSVAKVIAHQAVYPNYSIETTEETEAAYAARVRSEQARQCRVLRCIIGNPFSALTPNPDWRTRLVKSVAQAAYDERILPSGEFEAERLAVLADAIEEAGCSDQAILDHLRSPGPHVRGCWAVDLVLSKK
jgi:hypothetical protein